jgi:hypothetical protein
MRRIAVAALAAGFAAGALAAGAQAPAPQLSIDEIVEKNAAARGGLQAWRQVRTMAWVGHIQSAHAPMPNMQFVLQQERPNKTRFEINAMGEKGRWAGRPMRAMTADRRCCRIRSRRYATRKAHRASTAR